MKVYHSNASPSAGVMEHLYVHVPFCVRKCFYCAFYSVPVTESEEQIYLNALERELSVVKEKLCPKTIFIGGGTPSCLSEQGLKRLLHLVRQTDCRNLTEFSVEINPATVNVEKIKLFQEAGVNRISMGVQSLNDAMLKQLGRIHTKQEVYETFGLLRKTGFQNINLDLIFAVPGQTLEALKKTVKELLTFHSEHLSCYELTYEMGTPLTSWTDKTGFQPDELLSCQMYDYILDTLAEAGIHRYEISNFARSGYECQHNIAYWRGVDYYGAGPAACSLINGTRYSHARSLTAYADSVQRQQSEWLWEIDRISPQARAGEIAGVGLRMSRGWRFDEFYKITGFRLEKQWKTEMQRLCEQGNGEFFEGGFRLTRRGLRFADLAAEEFIRLEEDEC